MSSNRSAALASTITQVDLQPLDLPLTEPFAIAGGAPSVAQNVLVRVTLGDGTVGLGEAAPFPAVSGETQASTLLSLGDVRARLLGQDVRALRQLSAILSEVCPDEPAARAGCELALLDALLRQHRLPMWSFFGGQTRTLLRNAHGSRGVSLLHRVDQLPCYTLWKNTAASVDGNVTGLEPGTNFPNPRSFEGQHGRVVKLAAGASATLELQLDVHASAEEVAAAERSIAQLQGTIQPTVHGAPLPTWCA